MTYRMVAIDKCDCTDESDVGTCRSFANAVVGVQLGGSRGSGSLYFSAKEQKCPFL